MKTNILALRIKLKKDFEIPRHEGRTVIKRPRMNIGFDNIQ